MLPRQRVRQRRRLVMVWREDSEKLCARAVSQQILKRRLDVNPGSDWKLASGRCDLAGRHVEVFEQGLAQARLSKAPAADGKSKSHAAFMVASTPAIRRSVVR